MQKKLLFIVLMCYLIGFLFLMQLFAQVEKKEEARQALEAKNFSGAIEICLIQLEKNPDDYEFQYILARAYAFSDQWNKAHQIINEMLKYHPANIDVLLLKARIQAWQGFYSEAKKGFHHILSLDPKNKEALRGLADTAYWQGNLKEAENIYLKLLDESSKKADLYHQLGILYRNMGNYAKARKYLTEAVAISPDVEAYKHTLRNIHHKFKDRFEFRYHHNIQTFNDNRKDYIDNQFNLYLNIQKLQTSMLLWIDQTKRFDTRDHQYKFEIYPRLWKNSYTHFYYSFSPKAVHYPSSSYFIELYQYFLSSAEFSLGYRKMNFRENPASIYTGSLGYYWNQYYSWLKWYYTPKEKGNSLSWSLNIRRYFSTDNYIFLGFGIGFRPFEIMTLDDLWFAQTQLFLAGFNFFVMKRIRIQFFYTYQGEKEGLKRNSFLLISGFRF
ncbi:MAG: YaiO family outer membrane beta-barrel protein [Candidatus Aminicenantes bacterium]